MKGFMMMMMVPTMTMYGSLVSSDGDGSVVAVLLLLQATIFSMIDIVYVCSLQSTITHIHIHHQSVPLGTDRGQSIIDAIGT